MTGPQAARRRAIVGSLAALALVVVALEVGRGRWGFYEDEGINLLKAFMVAQGFRLYSEVYSDQAPLLTWLLALLIRGLGNHPGIFAQVAIGCGTGALAGCAAVARELGGRWAAGLCLLFLLALAPVAKFSSALTVGTAALALGTWSLYACLRYARTGRPRLLVGAGLLLGLAATVKLAALYLLPALLTPLLQGRRSSDQHLRRARAVALLLGAALAPLALAATLVPLETAARQLFQPHLAALQTFAGQAEATRRWVWMAPGMAGLLAATLAGLSVLWWRTDVARAAPVTVWLATVALWVGNVRPLWAHHLMDLMLPVAVCLALGSASALHRLGGGGARRGLWLVPIGVVALGLIGHLRAHDHWRRWFANASLPSLQATANLLAAETDAADWVLVDRPILAFLAGRRVPPELAMISQKRARTVLSDGDLGGALERYRPRLLVLCTGLFDRFPGFQRRLASDYLAIRRLPTMVGAARRSCRFFRRMD